MNASADLEAELSTAKAHLARLQRRQEASQWDALPNDQGVAESLFLHSREAEDRIELLGLHRDVVKLANDVVPMVSGRRPGSNADAAAGGAAAGGERGALAEATEACTALGLLLLRHREIDDGREAGEKTALGKFRAALVRWYDSLHGATRRAALDVFRTRLRAISPEYPSNERSSTLVAGALMSATSTDLSQQLNAAANCLVELQAVRDALLLTQSQRKTGQPEEDEQNNHNPPQQEQQHQLPTSWRLDIVDELCRPLAERLRFHFLEERTGIMAVSGSGDERSLRHPQRSEMDRLPEWLFRYLREVVVNHGVYSSVMRGGVQPLVDSIIDSLVTRCCSMAMDEESFGSNGDAPEEGGGSLCAEAVACTQTHEILQQLRRQYYDRSSAYFLREVARMARHALRAKSFFHHPDVVGSECRDRTIASRGIEQLFLFDSFLEERIDEGKEYRSKDPLIAPPRMVDAFLSSNEFLLRWWLEEERDGIISSLRRCAATTLSSHRSRREKEGPGEDMETSTGNTNQQQLCPPVSELFAALLHSARCKSNVFLDRRSRQMYVANVVVPMCSEYLDAVHVEAAWLRSSLLARPPAGTGVGVLRSPNLPSDELLASNATGWASLVAGTHLAARAVLLPGEEQDFHDDVLGRVGESMARLRNAMVEDFTSAFVETIVMERAKLASYMMRAPFLLSEPPSPERRGQRDRDKSGDSLSLSPDLNDSIHVVSIGVQACDATMRKLGEIFGKEGDDEDHGAANATEPNAMLRFGSRTIRGALKFAIGQKLLDIAIDPQGMTPEIYSGGARQFEQDVVAFERLFGTGEKEVRGVEPGPMERAAAASRLMSLEPSQMQTIREALRALILPSGGMGSLFGRRGDESTKGECYDAVENEAADRLDVNDFYRDERLMEEATNMLEAKGFAALSLNESLSIINRRC